VHVGPGRIAPADRPVVAVRPGADVPAELCRHLLRLGAFEPAGWRRRAAATAQVLADLVLTAAAPATPGPPQPALVAAVVEEVGMRWGAGLPLARVRVADLAASVHTSPSYLNRTVRATYGRPLSTLLEQVRLTRVELLLTGTSSTLAAIARACGFADAYHCSRRFSLAHGLSPSAYRAAGARPSLLDDPVVREVADAVWGRVPEPAATRDQSMSKIEFPS
jgi:AraC-like DNA-binding protein